MIEYVDLTELPPERYIDCKYYDRICLEKASEKDKIFSCVDCKRYTPVPLVHSYRDFKGVETLLMTLNYLGWDEE